MLAILSGYTDDLYGCLTNCSGFGQCTLTEASEFVCDCFQYHEGVACQHDLRPCSADPCLNAGECIESALDNNELTFSCNCTARFEGDKCETLIDVCANTTCSGHGYCYENASMPTCKCFGGYLGELCGEESNSYALIKKIIVACSYIAFIVLGSMYATFILLDISKYFCETNIVKKKIKPIRLKYKDFPELSELFRLRRMKNNPVSKLNNSSIDKHRLNAK